MAITTIKASELVEDFDLYPRGEVDSSHVGSLVQAMESGVELPPVIACRKTKRIVDGFHRRRAAIRVHGEDATLPVVLKTYQNDAELYAEAMSCNAAHGRRLTPVDFARATSKARALGMDDVTIARCLHLTVDRVAHLAVDRMARCGKMEVPLKQTIRHMQGRSLTKQQVAANDSLSGMSQVFYVNQIITLIEAGLLDTNNSKLMERLDHLSDLIESITVAS